MGEVDLATISSKVSSLIVMVLECEEGFFLFGIQEDLLFRGILEIVVEIWEAIIYAFS